MPRGSALRAAIASGFFLAAMLLPQGVCARDIPADFSYVWKIVFRGNEIGHARSRFSYREIGGNLFLTEAGSREFSVRLGVITIDFSEETAVVWDQGGLMTSFVSRSTVRDRAEERRAERRTDGAVVWKRAAGDEVKEAVFLPGEFDYTDADRFMTRLGQETDPRTLRILSISRGKVLSFTYRFLGRETVDFGDKAIRVSRVEMEGPGGNGTLLIDEIGIALNLTMETFFGDFSFVPVGPK